MVQLSMFSKEQAKTAAGSYDFEFLGILSLSGSTNGLSSQVELAESTGRGTLRCSFLGLKVKSPSDLTRVGSTVNLMASAAGFVRR